MTEPKEKTFAFASTSKLFTEFDEAAKRSGAQIKTLQMSGGNGADMLRGMLPMFEMVVAGECKGDPEETKIWWRGFCVAAHLMCLEHIGFEESLTSLEAVADILRERHEAKQTNPS